MRVISGEWRGRKLQAPAGDTTRPTADRTRETLFFNEDLPARATAVGAKLLYPNATIQHAGVIVGIGGWAGHSVH